MVELDSSSTQLFPITMWTKQFCNNNSKMMPTKAKHERYRDEDPIRSLSSITASNFTFLNADPERT